MAAENGENGRKITPNTLVNIGLLVTLIGATWMFTRQQAQDAATWRAEISNTYVTKEMFTTWASGFTTLMELRFENLKEEVRRVSVAHTAAEKD